MPDLRPSPAGEFTRTVLTFAFLAACATLFAGGAVLVAQKMRADVVSSRALLRIAAAQDRAYPFTNMPAPSLLREAAASHEGCR